MKIAILSSRDRCGIREYSQILLTGFRELEHDVRYIGVTPHNNRALMQAVRNDVATDDDQIIIEYEPGVFWLVGLVRAMLWLRLVARKRVLLSVHEIEPKKYPEFRQVRWHLARKVEANPWVEFYKLTAGGADVLLRFYVMRIGLLLLGALPHEIVVHSTKTAENIHIAIASDAKVRAVPHVIETIPGDRDAARAKLNLNPQGFVFISPGFLFRRKRLLDVAEQLPPNAEFWMVGTGSVHEPGYEEEIAAYVAQHGADGRIRLIQEYERMKEYLVAADAVVLYYKESYQSGIAAQAVGAGKPCIFTDLPAFGYLKDAGLVVRNDVELAQAMVNIQDERVYQRLTAHAHNLRAQYAPRVMAAAYLNTAYLDRACKKKAK